MEDDILLSINDLRRHVAPLREELLRAAARVVDGGRFVLGPAVESFEKSFADYCGSPHCIAVGSGTDALELALKALGVKPGDEVITAANAGGYASSAILAAGAVPRYADVDDDTLVLDPASIEEAIGARTRAVVVTHLYGRPAPMDRIMKSAGGRGLPVIEDCAQAHGAVFMGRRAGTWGRAGCFSFYPTKNLGALGDGGAVVCPDGETAACLRRLRQYGWAEKYRSLDAGGRNSRLDEIQAALLGVMLPRLDGWNARRRDIAAAYRRKITHHAVRHPAAAPDGDGVVHLYVVRADGRDALRRHLASRGIPSDVHYPLPDYRQPALAASFQRFRLEKTEAACATVLTLPCFPEMTEEETDRVAEAVNDWKR